MSSKEVVKPLQECAKERETIELYFQQGARRGGNNIALLICCAGESVR